MSDDKVTITLNGEEIQVDKGTTLLQAALDKDNDVPIFCYHEGLESSGYCRMCLVEVDTPRGKRLITSCNTPCGEGTVCDTHSENAVRGREAVLEFLLVNHPLDCPECDKAGECMLQDNSYGHGKASSRADFKDKVVKPRKELGEKIRLYSQRCIACRRCTQFLDQVSGTSELAFHQRGDHQDLDIFAGRGVENSLAKNIVDICPVGALIDKDFQYTTRDWLMTETESVCAGCAKGCAVTVDHEDGDVKRFQARRDDAVNGFWMCDHGRDQVGSLTTGRRDEARVDGRTVRGDAALEAAGRALGGEAVLIGSLFNTNEELRVARTLTSRVAGVIERPAGAEESFPGFTISADKNPNRAGAKAALDDLGDPVANLSGVSSVLILNAIPGYEPSEELIDALKGVENVVLVEAWESRLGDVATVILPAAAFTEKEGSFTNESGVERTLRFAVAPRGAARMDIEWLNGLVKARAKAGV